MEKVEFFARKGASFVYGGIATVQPNGSVSNYIGGGFVFAFNVTATIIFVCALVAVFYYLGIMQRIVALIARAMNFVMRVSGAEALSNVASTFVGQIEAQVMIRPYIKGMTKSELLASMSGSTSQPNLNSIVAALQQSPRETGLDLDALVDAGQWISQFLGRKNGSRAGAALAARRQNAAA
jgi:nucleoside permease NupC